MGYKHDFTGETQKVHCLKPVQWRLTDNILAAYWEARGDAGAKGHYLSANPRISLFFDDVRSIQVVDAMGPRPLAQAIYVPAGALMDTTFTRDLNFAHLDIHLDLGWAAQVLSPLLPRPDALRLLSEPAGCDIITDLEPIGRVIVGEVQGNRRPDLFLETLSASLLTGVLDLAEPASDPVNARLTTAQMRRVTARLEAANGQRLSIAQMAEAVNLSESWFSQVFKNTTGQTPHQWQLARRVEQSQDLLIDTDLSVADIADRLGFSDQAHMTRIFRQIIGETPAAWRRGHRPV